MVMTILEANVERQYWDALKSTYASETRQLDPGIVESYLVQSRNDENLWRIMTIWESQEVLNAMRKSMETPRGVLMFQSVRAQPTLAIFEILHRTS